MDSDKPKWLLVNASSCEGLHFHLKALVKYSDSCPNVFYTNVWQNKHMR